MKYRVEIEGMHCMGCSNLIKLSLEDAGFKDTVVDIKTNMADFKSSLPEITEVEKVLNKVFKDIPGYTYKNLKIIN